MAAYYGLMKNTAGLALSVKGIGAGNLAGGAANAYFERMPVVCLCESSPMHVTCRKRWYSIVTTANCSVLR